MALLSTFKLTSQCTSGRVQYVSIPVRVWGTEMEVGAKQQRVLGRKCGKRCRERLWTQLTLPGDFDYFSFFIFNFMPCKITEKAVGQRTSSKCHEWNLFFRSSTFQEWVSSNKTEICFECSLLWCQQLYICCVCRQRINHKGHIPSRSVFW